MNQYLFSIISCDSSLPTLEHWHTKLGLDISIKELGQCEVQTHFFYDAIAQKRSRIIEIRADLLEICSKIKNKDDYIWVLRDDLPLMQNKVYGDHYHILSRIIL
jgi:hypothetical protein